MAFDGIITMCMVKELRESILMGKINKIYQPDKEELLINIHTKNGNKKLYGTTSSQGARICLIENSFKNPESPQNFCMLLRKHIQNGRIKDIRQKNSERIIEIDIEAMNELGFAVSKRLIFEIMGKHSNIVLIDINSGKIIDSIKRISIDVNRKRQLLPGLLYEYPPLQDKIPFKELENHKDLQLMGDKKQLLNSISGISPAIAEEFAQAPNPKESIINAIKKLDDSFETKIYISDEKPIDFHVIPLKDYDNSTTVIGFDSLSNGLNYFYEHRIITNRTKQKSQSLLKSVKSSIEKAELKKKRLSEDLLGAKNSEQYKLYGELLTANIHIINPGDKSVEVFNYYDGEYINIPLSEKLNPSKNCQRYFKKYAKSKTAIKEKTLQLEENNADLEYLYSVLNHIECASNTEVLDEIKEELIETGYLRRKKTKKNVKKKSYKPSPLTYYLQNGQKILVGKNNKENDYLTFKMSNRNDIWLHTKDIPGSHVLIPLEPGLTIEDIDEKTIHEAAAIAAYYSKAGSSSNVPVDYVQIKYVKKPNGAKPGMVIFTNNRTIYVSPKLPNN